MSTQRSLIAFAVVFAASTSACYAGPCSQDIARLAAAWNAKLVAALHRQPTPGSIATAGELGGWTLEQAKAFTAAMGRAREADSANDETACNPAVADAEGALSKERPYFACDHLRPSLVCDAQWSGQQNTALAVCTGTCTATEAVRIKSLTTGRARIGLAFDWLMPYVTAGGALINT